MGGIEITGGLIAGGITVLILLISVINGLLTGGLRVIWSVGCVAAAVILAMVVNPAVSDFFNEQIHMDRHIEKSVAEYLELQGNDWLNDAGAKEQEAYIKELNIPASWKKSLVKHNTVDGYRKMVTTVFTGYIAKAIAGFSVKTLAFILTFVIVSLILRSITIFFSIMEKLPVIKQVNRMAGAAAGLVRGLLIIGVIMTFIAFIGNYSWGQFLVKQIMSNPISGIFYKYNLIAIALASIF